MLLACRSPALCLSTSLTNSPVSIAINHLILSHNVVAFYGRVVTYPGSDTRHTCSFNLPWSDIPLFDSRCGRGVDAEPLTSAFEFESLYLNIVCASAYYSVFFCLDNPTWKTIIKIPSILLHQMLRYMTWIKIHLYTLDIVPIIIIIGQLSNNQNLPI